jgi:hypothetical protein
MVLISVVLINAAKESIEGMVIGTKEFDIYGLEA